MVVARARGTRVPYELTMTSVAMMWKGCALKTEYNFMGRFAAKVVDVARQYHHVYFVK